MPGACGHFHGTCPPSCPGYGDAPRVKKSKKKPKPPRFIDIRTMVTLAKQVSNGSEISLELAKDMALALLQLHAGYERFRAELIRTAPRGSHGPGEWFGFYEDEVPKYPTIIHTHKSGRWPDNDK